MQDWGSTSAGRARTDRTGKVKFSREPEEMRIVTEGVEPDPLLLHQISGRPFFTDQDHGYPMGELRRPYPQSRPSSVEARRETATIRDSGYMVSASPRRTWRRILGVATVACVASIAVAGAIYAIFLSRRAISPEPATAEPTDEQRLLVSPAEITEEGAIILAEQAENDRRRFKLFSSLTGKGSFFLIDTKEKKISPIEEMDLVLPADQTTRYKIIFLKEDGKVIIWDLGVLPPEELESEGQTKCKEGGGRK